MTTDPRTRWALLTPTAPGPVAIIQLEGDVDGALSRLAIRPVETGAVALRSIAGVDTGVVARWSATCAHLMPHGGRRVVRAIIDQLERAGIAPMPAPDATWPEATGAVDAHLLDALARAASPMAIDVLLEHARRAAGGAAPVSSEHARMLHRLLYPPLVVATGASNIGKSTLVNALAGRHVSIVADEPATTRDHVGVELNLAGLVVRYVDTPGVLSSGDAIDQEARAIADEVRDRADLLLRCADHAHAPLEAPHAYRGDALTVALRLDLGEPAFARDFDVVAPEGRGIEALARAIRDRLVPPPALADPGAWRFWESPTPV